MFSREHFLLAMTIKCEKQPIPNSDLDHEHNPNVIPLASFFYIEL